MVFFHENLHATMETRNEEWTKCVSSQAYQQLSESANMWLSHEALKLRTLRYYPDSSLIGCELGTDANMPSI
jgi:hypothetical protein